VSHPRLSGGAQYCRGEGEAVCEGCRCERSGPAGAADGGRNWGDTAVLTDVMNLFDVANNKWKELKTLRDVSQRGTTRMLH
jgi:hypothetical protein